jgi:hypothetical protein
MSEENKNSQENQNPKQQLEDVLIESIVMFRDQMLRACSGRPPMNYWEQIANRLKSSARQCATAAEWITTVQRGLRIQSPSSSDCSVIQNLVSLCDVNGFDLEMMEIVEREVGFLIAMARGIVDGRKSQREHVTSFTREAVIESAEKNGLLSEV